VHGDFWGGSANISLKDGTRLAHIGRDMLNTSEVMADQQTVSCVFDSHTIGAQQMKARC